MTTILTEMLGLPNFGIMTRSTILFLPNDEIFFLTSQTEIKTSFPLFQYTLILRRPGVANFADIICISRYSQNYQCLVKKC